MQTWKTLRDGRLKSHGVHPATLDIARMHSLALAGKTGGGHRAAKHARETCRSFTGQRLGPTLEWRQPQARETMTVEGFSALAWGIQSTRRFGASP